MTAEEKAIYIIATQTGTWFSKFLQAVNKAPYNHLSISLSPTLSEMYSFGRQCLWLPLAGGFVREQPGKGIYRQYPDTQCAVYRIAVTNSQYKQLTDLIDEFEGHEWEYRYNFLGLAAMFFGIPMHRKHHFVCSQFVAYLLEESGIWFFRNGYSLVRPQDITAIPAANRIYSGKLAVLCKQTENAGTFGNIHLASTVAS